MAESTRRRWQTTTITERLGVRFPIVQGPFGGGRSTPELAAAATEAGALGSFGAADPMPLWAGQNLPLVRRRSVAELMAFLVEDIDRVAAQFGRWSRGGHTHAGHPSTLIQEQVQS